MSQMRERDVYEFRYNDETRKKMFDSRHCFDGQLVAVPDGNGGLILQDTFWMHRFEPCSSGRTFTPDEAREQGELTFYCNLDEVEQIGEHDCDYYAKEDVFNLSHQHGCYKFFAKRKGAQRDKERMLAAIRETAKKARDRIDSGLRDLERCAAAAQRIEDGHLAEVWLP